MSHNSNTTDPETPAAGWGCCPLVLGECVQGRLRGGLHFLITAPLNLFSWARFEPRPDIAHISVDPPERTKSRAAVEYFLDGEGLPTGGVLSIETPLEPAHGFGTSTADICASIRAAAAAWGRNVVPETLSRIAVSIEPTDGSMYEGSVAYAHRAGVLLESLGRLPPFEALVGRIGSGIDSRAFDLFRKDYEYPARDEDRLFAAWSQVRHAIRRQDLGLMGKACTVSSWVNQQLLHKPLLSELTRFARGGGADGVMVAHSGTLHSLLLDPVRPDHLRRKRDAVAFLESLVSGIWFEVSNQVSQFDQRGLPQKSIAERVFGRSLQANSRQ